MTKKDLNKMTFSELKTELAKLEKEKDEVLVKKKGVWQVGKNYVIRTVTMIQVGKLIEVTDNELVLSDASWVADTDRWTQFLKNGTVSEVELFCNDVIVGRNSIIDATIWNHKLFDTQK